MDFLLLWVKVRLALVIPCLLCLPAVVWSSGSSTFQCPNGHFLSRFSSAFDGSERFYKFSCTRFSVAYPVFDEVCVVSDVASTENGDLYLGCGSDQYTAGVEVTENVGTAATTWQLLCCSSDAVRVRSADCIDTKFLNDIRRSSSFTSGAQIVRKWQAMLENDDLRWWLQLCPVDLNAKKVLEGENVEVRARRQIPWEWSRGRFPPFELSPVFMEQERLDDRRRLRLFENTNQVQVFPGSGFVQPMMQFSGQKPMFPVVSPPSSLTTLSMPSSDLHSPIGRSATTMRPEDSTESTAFATEKSVTSKLGSDGGSIVPVKHEDSAIDYYDAYDENFDKAKHEGRGGFLSGVSDFLQNLQDGLSLAQAVMPNTNRKVVPYQSTTEPPSFLLSRDDDSVTIEVKGDHASKLKSEALLKLQRFGPNPPRPAGSQPKVTAAVKLGEPGTIEQMLQFFGLCKGHEL